MPNKRQPSNESGLGHHALLYHHLAVGLVLGLLRKRAKFEKEVVLHLQEKGYLPADADPPQLSALDIELPTPKPDLIEWWHNGMLQPRKSVLLCSLQALLSDSHVDMEELLSRGFSMMKHFAFSADRSSPNR